VQYLDIDAPKRISKIGLGTWQFGSAEWGYGESYAEREARAIVRRALDLGITLFDTAEIYSSGRSERILGQALGAGRPAAFVGTKMFPLFPTAAAVRHRARASARRLDVACIDLYQSHFPNPLVSDQVIMRGMRSLQDAGRIGEVGVSNYPVARWRAAEDALGGRILTNQVAYSLLDRAPERSLLPFAADRGRVVIAFSPLGHGLLSGRYHDGSRPLNQVRAGHPLFSPDSLDRTRDLIATLRAVAAGHRATPAQVALAWVIRHPAVAAIPGASSVAQVESNAAAADLTLADDEYDALSAASAAAGATAAPAAEAGQDLASALRHCARCGWYVARTSWRDYRTGAAW
jgi:aryl-alcohol dehydrogenase-like predicted oxidoreductase